MKINHRYTHQRYSMPILRAFNYGADLGNAGRAGRFPWRNVFRVPVRPLRHHDGRCQSSKGNVTCNRVMIQNMWFGNSWGVLCSQRKDFKPLCTTELAKAERPKPKWDKRSVPERVLTSAVAIAAALILPLGNNSASAEGTSCPFAGQKPMLIVQMLFGQNIERRAPVTQKEWQTFLREVVTPRLPDGFTEYDSHGQWMSPLSHVISREKSKVIIVASEDTPAARARIDELTTAYRKQFHQESVGVLTTPGCGRF